MMPRPFHPLAYQNLKGFALYMLLLWFCLQMLDQYAAENRRNAKKSGYELKKNLNEFALKTAIE